jgi:hypothetical protein
MGSGSEGVYDTSFTWVGIEARVERRIPIGGVDVRAGARGIFLTAIQELERKDRAQLQGSTSTTEQRFKGTAGGVGAVARCLFDFGRIFAHVGGGIDVLAARRGSSFGAVFAAEAEAGVGWNF